MTFSTETSYKPRTTTNSWLFWALVAASVLFYNAPLFSAILQPINTFATMIHEMSHALVCLLTGGSVSGMTIVSDANGHGGLTFCHYGNPLLYTPAGYLGTAVAGCALVFLSQYQKISKLILFLMGLGVAAASFALVGANVLNTGWQGVMSFLWAVAIAAFLCWAGLKWRIQTANFLLLFLAIQVALNSLTSLVLLSQVSLGVIPLASFSDATNMEAMTGLPAWLWSIAWSLTSVIMLFVTLSVTYGRGFFKKH